MKSMCFDKGIFIDEGQILDIVAPKPLRAGDADSATVQYSAPPQIVWTDESVDRSQIIQSYGDIIMKNIWVRFADFLGNQVRLSSITFENQEERDDPERGYFDGCIFDYSGHGFEGGGTITVKADHFEANSKTAISGISRIQSSSIMAALFPFPTKVPDGITTGCCLKTVPSPTSAVL